MKLLRARIENFKGIKELDLDFRDEEGKPRPLVALIGDNGSGKTTVLQAIALTLELATLKIFKAEDFQWPGFLLERTGTLGNSLIELDVEINVEMVEARRYFIDKTWEIENPDKINNYLFTGLRAETIKITYQYGSVNFPGIDRRSAIREKHYLRELAKEYPELISDPFFNKLGEVHWFDQARHMGTISHAQKDHINGIGEVAVNQYREKIKEWWLYRSSPMMTSNRDYIGELQEHFQRVFPDVVLAGFTERINKTKDSSPLFMLKKGDKLYDLAEMSSGEQAVFPLVMEFVRQNIANSIILIDELELHLHPPQQRLLLQALRKIGPDCQFIFTTHSSWLEGVLAVEEIIRLPGGRLCL